jgi:hypothetical protein
MRVGFPTGTHRHRSADEGHSLRLEENVLNDERIASANSELSFEAIFWSFTFCIYLNLNLTCNNSTLT